MGISGKSRIGLLGCGLKLSPELGDEGRTLNGDARLLAIGCNLPVIVVPRDELRPVGFPIAPEKFCTLDGFRFVE
jgi:hypothetical protein